MPMVTRRRSTTQGQQNPKRRILPGTPSKSQSHCEFEQASAEAGEASTSGSDEIPTRMLVRTIRLLDKTGLDVAIPVRVHTRSEVQATPSALNNTRNRANTLTPSKEKLPISYPLAALAEGAEHLLGTNVPEQVSQDSNGSEELGGDLWLVGLGWLVRKPCGYGETPWAPAKGKITPTGPSNSALERFHPKNGEHLSTKQSNPLSCVLNELEESLRKSLEGLDLQRQEALSWQSSWDGIQSRASTVIKAMKADIEHYEEECLMALKAHVQHVTQAVVLMHLMRLVLVGVYSNDEAYSVITNDGGSRLELTAGEGDGCEESGGVHEWVFGPQWSVRTPRGYGGTPWALSPAKGKITPTGPSNSMLERFHPKDGEHLSTKQSDSDPPSCVLNELEESLRKSLEGFEKQKVVNLRDIQRDHKHSMSQMLSAILDLLERAVAMLHKIFQDIGQQYTQVVRHVNFLIPVLAAVYGSDESYLTNANSKRSRMESASREAAEPAQKQNDGGQVRKRMRMPRGDEGRTEGDVGNKHEDMGNSKARVPNAPKQITFAPFQQDAAAGSAVPEQSTPMAGVPSDVDEVVVEGNSSTDGMTPLHILKDLFPTPTLASVQPFPRPQYKALPPNVFRSLMFQISSAVRSAEESHESFETALANYDILAYEANESLRKIQDSFDSWPKLCDAMLFRNLDVLEHGLRGIGEQVAQAVRTTSSERNKRSGDGSSEPPPKRGKGVPKPAQFGSEGDVGHKYEDTGNSRARVPNALKQVTIARSQQDTPAGSAVPEQSTPMAGVPSDVDEVVVEGNSSTDGMTPLHTLKDLFPTPPSASVQPFPRPQYKALPPNVFRSLLFQILSAAGSAEESHKSLGTAIANFTVLADESKQYLRKMQGDVDSWMKLCDTRDSTICGNLDVLDFSLRRIRKDVAQAVETTSLPVTRNKRSGDEPSEPPQKPEWKLKPAQFGSPENT